MLEFVERKRWTPLWASIPLFAFWCIALAALAHEYFGGPRVNWHMAAGVAPLYLTMGYLLFAVVVGTSSVRADQNGMHVTHGSLPGLRSRRWVPRDSIRCVYHREILVPTSSGTVKQFGAGVVMKDDRHVPLVKSYNEPAPAQTSAEKLARVLNYGHTVAIPVEVVTGFGKRNWRGGLIVLAWFGAVIAELLFAAFMEVAR